MPESVILDPDGLRSLIERLQARGYRTIAPTVRRGAVVLADIAGLADLPRGVGDEQAPAHYRLRPTEDERLFAFAAPAQSAKAVLFPPDELLWSGRRTPEGGFSIEPGEPDGAPIALIGLRGCDLAAIAIHDRVLLGRASVDTHYAQRRRDAILIAVTCGTPASTCFCSSMGTGPKPGSGADLTLTELVDPHRFLAEAGTPRGEELLAALSSRPAGPEDSDAAEAVVAAAVAAMGRALDTEGLPELLSAGAESPHWSDVAARCLACSNCTSVCPTCFCTSIEDVSDLTGELDERHRVWDSCFSREYSRLHSGSVRTSVASRYRQWLTHKLGTWSAQFGTAGCVGCGRCITWCPAGIDLTEEVASLRELAAAAAGRSDTVPTDSDVLED
jgi:sulfhydrogenase subunit beta (sulfur reductase)